MANVAVVGATGAVGVEAIQVLQARDTKIDDLRLFASAKSVEMKRSGSYKGTKILVEDLATADFRGIDFAIFSAGSGVSKKYAPIAKTAGCIVIDNSSALRMITSVPLVVPEINADALQGHSGIIANPNCTTAITLMGLYPLHRAFGAKRISVASYQAASGAGEKGLHELREQLAARHATTCSSDADYMPKRLPPVSPVFPYPIALNVFPHVGAFLENDSTDEEMKMLNESRKIMRHATLLASTTCARVSVERVHCMDVLAQFERPVELDEALHALRAMPGLDVFEGRELPTPLEYAGKYNCAVARVRVDQAFENSLRFWVLGDQLLKGAALNAVQILEHLIAG